MSCDLVYCSAFHDPLQDEVYDVSRNVRFYKTVNYEASVIGRRPEKMSCFISTNAEATLLIPDCVGHGGCC